MKHDCDSNSAGDKDQQGDQELYIAWNSDMSVLLGKSGGQRAGGDAREHREPAVGYRQGPFVNEKHQSADAG